MITYTLDAKGISIEKHIDAHDSTERIKTDLSNAITPSESYAVTVKLEKNGVLSSGLTEPPYTRHTPKITIGHKRGSSPRAIHTSASCRAAKENHVVGEHLSGRRPFGGSSQPLGNCLKEEAAIVMWEMFLAWHRKLIVQSQSCGVLFERLVSLNATS